MTPPRELFPRTDLANRFAGALVDPAATSSMPSGLFLAAPRRTGKSTFLRADLGPALERRDVLVIYVDLWADRAADPAVVIAGAVQKALVERAGDGGGLLERVGRKLGVDSISLGGVAVSATPSTDTQTLSLGDALEALSEHTRRMIALFVDEAQQANTTEAGSNALYSLKAVRDELNSGDRHGLRVVATGSNRHKLATLVSSKSQAFYRAPLLDLAPLDEHYVRWFVARQPFGDDLDVADAAALFERAGHQPELLAQAADRLRLDPAVAVDVPLAVRLSAHLEAAITADDAEVADAIAALDPLARAVLCELAARGGAPFAPFAQATLKRYATLRARLEGEERAPPNVSAVQRALAALQDAGLVWRSHRGVYALEEERIGHVMREQGLLE